MGAFTFDSWQDCPPGYWHWPDFSPAEMACRGTGELKIDVDAMSKLQALRDHIGKPLIVQSAYRSAEHNRKVGGARHSMHLRARAFDISMSNHDPAAFEAAARACGFTGFGFYVKQNFMHIDTGPARQWGKPFPPRPVVAPSRRRRPDPEVMPADDPEPIEDGEAVPDRFAPEPTKPGWLETILKPEVLVPTGGAGFGVPAALEWIGETLKASVPLQIAAAVLVVAGVIGVGAWLVLRLRSVRAGD